MNFRKIHRKAAPILFLPLFATALTGVIYSLGENWFGLSDEVVDIFLEIHQGEFLGKPLVPFYVLLMGVGLLGLIITGLTMIKRKLKSQPKMNARWLHSIVAPIAFLPLAVSSITGIAYRLGRAWFGLSGEQGEILLHIHQGSYFGSFLKPIYVLLVGLGLILLLITGIQMTRIFSKPRSKPSQE